MSVTVHFKFPFISASNIHYFKCIHSPTVQTRKFSLTVSLINKRIVLHSLKKQVSFHCLLPLAAHLVCAVFCFSSHEAWDGDKVDRNYTPQKPKMADPA